MQMVSPIQEWATMRRGAQFCGWAMLFLALLGQLLFSVVALVLVLTGVLSVDALSSNTLGLTTTNFLLLYLPVYAAVMGLPMLLACAIFKPSFSPFDLNEKVRGGTFFAAMCLLLGLCTVANIVANVVSSFFHGLGVQAPDAPVLAEADGLNILLNVVIFAVLPALLEEFFFRGYVLQALRPYGDGFAVVVSAILFGLMHSNLTQLPFAFLLGLGFGYVTVRLGNIWAAVTVHFLNNALAVILGDVLPLYVADETVCAVVTAAVFGALLIAALICLLVLRARRHPLVMPHRTVQNVPLHLRVRACFGAPTLWIAIAIYIVLTATNVTIG